MRRRKTLKTRKLAGFTLAELVVVVTVLAVLSAIGFLALSWYSQDAKDSAVKTNVRSVYSAIMAESTSAGNSPRYYVVHDPAYALSGGLAFFDGNPSVLTGGDWNVPNTNYSAWNPDYAKLKLNKEKFKTASSRYSPWRPEDAFAASANPAYLLVGAMDATETAPAWRVRVKPYVQVAGALSAKVPSVTGNFPVSSTTGSVAGLIRDPVSATLTWAMVDGIATWTPLPCVIPATATNASLAYVLTSTGILENGESGTRNGTHSFGTSPANGTLTASFAFACSNGTVSVTPANVSGTCQTNYSWNSSWTAPACGQSAFGFNQTISANTANYDLKARAVAAGWNQALPLNATVTVAASVTVYGSTPSVAAFTVWALPAGSIVTIVNQWSILWAGGNGGNGNGNGGGGGGDAIAFWWTVTASIDNQWNVFGGGGGGGGWAVRTNTNVLAWGGGGGGGQWYAGGAGWAGGDAYAWAQYPYGYAGGAGNSSWPGGGGSPGNSGYYPNQWSGGYCIAGVGWNGGGWWSAWSAGGVGSGGYCPDYTPGNGWAGGYAVRKNGATVTWISWNNGTQVKWTVN